MSNCRIHRVEAVASPFAINARISPNQRLIKGHVISLAIRQTDRVSSKACWRIAALFALKLPSPQRFCENRFGMIETQPRPSSANSFFISDTLDSVMSQDPTSSIPSIPLDQSCLMDHFGLREAAFVSGRQKTITRVAEISEDNPCYGSGQSGRITLLPDIEHYPRAVVKVPFPFAGPES
jgi:hypothetical protein